MKNGGQEIVSMVYTFLIQLILIISVLQMQKPNLRSPTAKDGVVVAQALYLRAVAPELPVTVQYIITEENEL